MKKIDMIRKLLHQACAPESLMVEDESSRHIGHASAPQEGESHFSVRIVAPHFAGLTRLERHRRIHEALADVIGQIHALSIKALTPEESAEEQSAKKPD